MLTENEQCERNSRRFSTLALSSDKNKPTQTWGTSHSSKARENISHDDHATSNDENVASQKRLVIAGIISRFVLAYDTARFVHDWTQSHIIIGLRKMSARDSAMCTLFSTKTQSSSPFVGCRRRKREFTPKLVIKGKFAWLINLREDIWRILPEQFLSISHRTRGHWFTPIYIWQFEVYSYDKLPHLEGRCLSNFLGKLGDSDRVLAEKMTVRSFRPAH